MSLFFVFQTGTHYSRAATAGFIFWGVFSILTVRALVRNAALRALDAGTLAGRRVVVIGDPEELTEISSGDLLRTYGAKEMARFELMPRRTEEKSSPRRDLDIVDAAIRSAQASGAEQILLAMRWSDVWRKDMICERLRLLPLPAFLLPDRSVRVVIAGTDVQHSALTAIEVQRAPMSRQDLVVKRLFDFVLASVGLIALSPLLLITGLAIKLDSPGPVIFRQRRRGFNGQQFSIYKFRTMSVLEDGPDIRQAQRDDDRVTRFGRVLRMSSIDELPQLLNVIQGKMSMVGPRPHAIAHDNEYSASIENYAFRHHVKPGITGWAQTHGFRGETPDLSSMKRRIQLDLWYINNWSLWLDFRIVARTTIELLRHRNAY
jgi:undecaprenyl-phosphate galactose phosphotransferase/putative colanic acid biosynthesis UDP-glucose lipid carrier transferase